jgi:hypothetical protein
MPQSREPARDGVRRCDRVLLVVNLEVIDTHGRRVTVAVVMSAAVAMVLSAAVVMVSAAAVVVIDTARVPAPLADRSLGCRVRGQQKVPGCAFQVLTL